MPVETSTDVLVVGGGPAGASVALRLMDQGVGVVLVEKEQFPRFHIGESMSGEAGRIVRELGFEEEMDLAGHPIKHGVTVYSPRKGNEFFVPVAARNETGALQDEVTWQVRRSEFDRMLLDEAKRRGVEYISGKAVAPLMAEDDRTVAGARIAADRGEEIDVKARITLDCSGMANFLANKKVTGEKYSGSYDKQIAVFSHIENFVRDRSNGDRRYEPGNTHIFYAEKYHWSWAIPIDGDITSVGIVIPAEYFRSTGESQIDFLRREMLSLQPSLAERIDGEPRFVEDARVIRNYSFQVRRFAGPGYICVGDSHRFIDPIFSFGLFVALREAELAAETTARYLEGSADESRLFHDHMVEVERGVDMLEDLVDVFWENPLAFSVMAHRRYREGVTDLFSGRVFEDRELPERDAVMKAIHKLLKRERNYDDDSGECRYSIPVGSRYDESRAGLYDSQLGSVEAAEQWMEKAV